MLCYKFEYLSSFYEYHFEGKVHTLDEVSLSQMHNIWFDILIW